MSMIERTIAIIFEGDDRSTAAFSSVSSRLGNLERSVENTAGKLAIAADGIVKLDAALFALAAGGLAYAYTKSVEFESAVIELQKVVGSDNVAALDAARVAALNLSDTYGVSATKILLSTAEFKQAGFTVEEAMLLAKNALDLVIAGNIDAALASDLLISALKGFREPASEASRLIDILNEVSNNYATNVEELATGMARLAPIAKTMGFSMEETAGMLTPVIEIFGSGEEAANALKTGLLKLIDDTKPVREALASIGVSQTDANGALRSGRDILFDVARAFTTLDENQKLFVTQQLVGIEQSARMVEVFNGLSKTLEITNVALNASGSAAAEVAARLASAEVQIDRFKQGFVNLGIVVGDQFKVAVTSAISGATEIENALRQMVSDGTFAPVFDLINEFSTDLGNLLRQVAQNLPEAFKMIDWSGFVQSLRDLGQSFGSIFDGVDVSTPEGLAKVLQTLLDLLTGLIRVTDGMVEAFKPFARQIYDIIQEIGRGDQNLQEFIGNLLAFAKLISSVGLEIVAIGALLNDTNTSAGKAITYLADALGFLWEALAIGFKGAVLAFVGAADTFNQALDWLTGPLLDEYFGRSHAFFVQLKEDLVEGVAGNLEDLSYHFDGLADDMTNVGGYIESVNQKFAKLAETTNDTSAALDRTGRSADDMTGKMLRIPTKSSTNFVAIGIDEAKALIESYGVDISRVPEEKLLALAAATDTESFAKAWTDIRTAVPAEVTTEVKPLGVDKARSLLEEYGVDISRVPEELITKLAAATDEASLLAALQEIKGVLDTTPIAAKVSVEADEAKLERLKQQFDLMQTAVEWKAKLDIAEVQANAQIVEALAGTLSAAFSSSAEIISSSVSALAQYDETFDLTGNRNFLKNVIQDELDLRERSMRATEALIEKQIEYMNAKLRSMSSGDALVQIDGAGLQPHLEAFMWEILSAIQTRVNEEGHAMLFGI